MRARRNRILAKMSVLSEQRASRLEHRPEKVYVRHSESQVPNGVRAHDDLGSIEIDGPPSKWDDVFGHYKWRFERAAGDFYAQMRLCAQAEVDYAKIVGGNQPAPRNEDGPVKDRRILSEYVGIAAWEVATWEDCDVESVHRLRRLNELDPFTGYPDENLTEVQRGVICAIRNGATEREAALAYGISRDAVRRAVGSRN